MKKAGVILFTLIIATGSLFACNKASNDEDESSSGYTDPGTAEIVDDYPYLVTESSLFVRRDGSITSADVEDFDEDYYDADEFEENYVEPAVLEYNEKQGYSYTRASESEETLPVAIDSITNEDGVLTLQLNYKDAAEYLSFNKEINEYYDSWETFIVCAYADLADYGISIDATIINTDGEEVDLNTVNTTTGLYACVLGFNGALPTGFSGKLQFEGAITYTSEGIYIQSDNSVRVYDSEDLQYILFK